MARQVLYDADDDGNIDLLYQDGTAAGQNIYLRVNNGSGDFTTTYAANSGTFSSGPLNRHYA